MWTYGEEKTIYVAIDIDKPVVALSILIMVFSVLGVKFKVQYSKNDKRKWKKTEENNI